MSQRTTLTLEDDVVSRLKAEARRTGKPFKDVVNEAIRRGLDPRIPAERKPFQVAARNLGLRSCVDLDDIEGLLDRMEGPGRR